MMGIDFFLVVESLPRLLSGVQTSLSLFATGLVAGTALSFLIVLLRLSGSAPLAIFAFGYAYFFRSTPFLVQIFVVYYGASQFDFIRRTFLWEFFREPFFCFWLTLTLNVAARVSEVLRGGIIGVPKGLKEAALATGLNSRQCFIYITAPIAIRLSLPAYSNEMVSAIKATSLASMITLLDVTGVARTIVAQTFRPYELFLSAAIFYICMTWIIQFAVRRAELHLNRNL